MSGTPLEEALRELLNQDAEHTFLSRKQRNLLFTAKDCIHMLHAENAGLRQAIKELKEEDESD